MWGIKVQRIYNNKEKRNVYTESMKARKAEEN